MAPFAGTGAGEWRAGGETCCMQARDQIVWQERAIARHTGEPFTLRQMQRRPIQAGENAGEGAGETRHAVGDHRQLGIGKALRVAVGVDQEAVALRRKASDHAVQNGGPADRDSRLVAATHPARQTAGKHEPESCRKRRVHCAQSSCTAALRRCFALSSAM